MCELFAVSSRLPATVNFCLEEFARHGGLTGPHKDGWGISYYAEDGAVRLYKEPEPASGSEWVRFIEEHRIRAAIVLSHIRRATQGGRSLKNTQPFRRELGGKFHVFAHNGDLVGIADDPAFTLGSHRPVGETDSEYAFCALMARLQALWLSCSGVPAIDERLCVITEFARDLRRLGTANFLYSDSDALFVHGNERRNRPDEAARPPGLHVLHRTCGPEPNQFCADGLQIASASGRQEMVLVASVPLTDEDWRPLECGEVLTLRQGKIVARLP